MAKVFISYKRNVEPDEPLALRLYEALQEHCDVFIDQKIPLGMDWGDRIQAELETCDCLIPLLSEHSVQSEMVEAEISTAHRLGKAGAGKPRILPVRVAYKEPFKYPLSAYLDRLNWAIWESEADTEPLIKELLSAIAGGELSGRRPLESVTTGPSATRQSLKEKLSVALRDPPIWQVIGVGVAFIAFMWGVYTFRTVGSVSGSATPSPSPMQAATTIAMILTATDTVTFTPTWTPTSPPPTATTVPPTASSTPMATKTPTQTPVPPTATATNTPTPTATSTSMATDTLRPSTPTPVPTAVPQPAGPIALTIYLRDTRTETGFAALSGDQVNGGMIYEEGKFVYGEAAVQIGETTYHFDKPEVEPGEPEQLPDPWRVEFEFAEQLVARTGNQAGFDPKKAQFWVGPLGGDSAVGEESPYSLTMKLYEGNELRESIQVFFTVADAPGPGPGPEGTPGKPPPP